MEKLKKRWKIKSNIQLLLIFLAFAVNGSFASWVAKSVTNFVGLEKELLSPFYILAY